MRDLYFDYDLQVWVRGGKIMRCGHPESMSTATTACCNGSRLAGLTISEARELEQADKATDYTCTLCGQHITDGKPCGCGAR